MDVPMEGFPTGTRVQHFGYDLTNYTSPIGPTSVYGLLNGVLFDPILPVWFDNRVHGWRRVIKGSRNALNGAIDDGDEEKRGPTLSHSVPMFYVNIGEAGTIGIEYWVLETTKTNQHPSKSFINPSKPIILTLHGQSHAELSQLIVRKAAELPYLRQRLICHVDCDRLTPGAKRLLFVSNREDARRGQVYSRIEEEVIKALRSDDDLTRLNDEARERGMQEHDQEAQKQMQSEVARLLRIQGVNVEAGGGVVTDEPGNDRPVAGRRGPRPKPKPIEAHEPPTYVRIVWDEEDPIMFYPDQRRYVRIETDADSSYHNAANLAASRMNFIASGGAISLAGTTPLKGGRMRAIFNGLSTAKVGDTGAIRVELTRPGQPVLSDERAIEIVAPLPAKPGGRKVSVPRIDPRPVSPDDDLWGTLNWPDDHSLVASDSEVEAGVLVVYYSTVFPNFANQLATLERSDPALAKSFRVRYTIWLAVHSVLLQQDQERPPGAVAGTPEQDPDAEELRERQERVRMAALSSMFALREVKDMKEASVAEVD